jgi:hypothetical protein
MDIPTNLNEIVQLSPPIALALGLNIVGAAIKKIGRLDSAIPLVLISLGAVIYPFISEMGKVDYECRNPMVLLGIYGALIGSASVGLNQMFRQFLATKDSGSTDTNKPDTK